MASRGGRGGRGGWRGGRSGAAGRGGLQAPGLKDDEGNLVQPELNAGPPPLYPALELKQEPPDPSAHDKLLLLRRDDLIRFFKYSPYHIEVKVGSKRKPKMGSQAADELEESEEDRLQKKASLVQQQKPPLTSLLTLHPHHFPEELFTEKDKRMAARSTRQGDVMFRRTPAAEDGEAAEQLKKRLEKLNKQEQQQQKDPAAATAAASRQGADKEAAAEDEDPHNAAVFDEDDDDVMEEDDYYQGEVYDDDEGYDDYDDGRDEGPVY